MDRFWQDLQAKRDRLSARIELLEEQANEIQIQEKETEATLLILQEALSLARKCLESSVERKEFLEKIVTLGLQAIYDSEISYLYKEEFDKNVLKGLRVVCQSPAGFVDDIDESFGGGAQAASSMLTTICSAAFNGQKFVAFDEPVPYLPDYQWLRLEEVLNQLIEQLGVQVFITTHARPMGTTYWVSMDEDEISHIQTASAEEIKRMREELYEEDSLQNQD